MKVRFGDYVLDPVVPELRRNGDIVSVEPQVFDILVHLIENRDRIVTKDELIEAIWHGRVVSDAAVTSRMNLVRQAVGDSGRAQTTIRTIPKRGFRFVADIDREDGTGAERDRSTGSPAEAGDTTEISILVLPFADLSRDGSGYLAEGLTEDLIVALSRYSEVAVISLNTALKLGDRQSRLENPLAEVRADYLVTGTVRVSGERLVVTVQLSEKATGTNIHTERYDREVGDVFAIQDEIVQSLAGCLPWRVIEAEGRRIVKTGAPRLSSYQAFIRAQWGWGAHRDIHELEADLAAIVDDDPGFAPARAELAFVLGYKVFFTGRQDEGEMDRALAHARAAIKLAPDNERVLAKSAMIFQFAGQFEVALRLSYQAIRLNPNSTECTHFRGTILGASGDTEAALVHHQRTMALDPLFPEGHYEAMIEALYLLARYDDALDLLDRWADPPFHVLAFGAASAAMAGDTARAQRFAADFARRAPEGYSNAVFVGAMLRYHRRPEDRDHWLRGYEAAGIPEMDVVRRSGAALPE